MANDLEREILKLSNVTKFDNAAIHKIIDITSNPALAQALENSRTNALYKILLNRLGNLLYKTIVINPIDTELVKLISQVETLKQSEAITEALTEALHRERINLVNLFLDKNKTALNNILIYCSKTNNTKIIKKIIGDNSLDINYKDKTGGTALLYAVQTGLLPTVQLLLEHQASPNTVDNIEHERYLQRWPILLYAILQGDIDIVKLLLKYGACPNYGLTEDMDLPPLLVAAISDNSPEITTTLLAKGAKINGNANKIIELGAGRGHFSLVKELIRYFKQNQIKWDINKVFLNAIRSNSDDLIDFLMQFKPDLNCKDEQGNTPLMLAAKGNKINLCLLLIANRVNVNHRNAQGISALQLAVKNNQVSVVVTLLMLEDLTKQDIESALNIANSLKNHKLITILSDEKVKTNIVLAAKINIMALVKVAIKNKADLNMRDRHNRTALHIAAYNGNLDLVELLIESGAHAYVLDENEKTPYMYAQSRLSNHLKRDSNYKKIMEILKLSFHEELATSNTTLLEELKNLNFKALKALWYRYYLSISTVCSFIFGLITVYISAKKAASILLGFCLGVSFGIIIFGLIYYFSFKDLKEKDSL